jgi:diguanylate cyclase (GGDEF)-like protein/PAS domain S-box-containing protein
MMLPDDVEKTIYHFKKAIKEKHTESYEVALRHQNGHRVELSVLSIPIIVDDQVMGIYGLAKDITEEKRMQEEILEKTEELRKSHKDYRLITENAFDVIKLISPTGIVEYVSPSNEKLLGSPLSEYVGKSYLTHIHPDDVPILKDRRYLNSLIDGSRPSTAEIRIRHKNGHYIWMETNTTPIIEEGEVQRFVTISRDITERKKLREELEKAAFYDYLSGLPNRRTFDDRLQMAILHAYRSKKKVAVMMLDGKKFKQINDMYGHDAGDAVIVEMANRLQASVRDTDTVARMGGDEMAIILPNIDSFEVVEDIAKRIINSFEEPLHFRDIKIQMGAGVGIALYPDHAVDKKLLVKYADEALYEAKESDKNEFRVYRV